jgi:putative ABC transport system ATP-binding protein
VVALEDLSFEVASGEWIAVMGPSGSGKTTLINILGGLDLPTAGRVVVDGVDLATMARRDLSRYRAERIGFIFQQFHLVPYLTAVENVMLAQYFHSMVDEAEARRALEAVGLGDRLEHLPSQLSGGEQQRVSIARALINQPKLILVDEPTGNLDERNEEIVMNLFREMHSQGHTIVMVTHDATIGRMADRRIELQHGRLAEITVFRAEEEERFDHLLEQIWIFREEQEQPEVERVRISGGVDPRRTLALMADVGLVRVDASEIGLTPRGEERARELIRRRRLAERLFSDTFELAGEEAESQACRFEHVLSPDVTDKICSFLGHPAACPHGNPIPAGTCCPDRR